MMKRALLPCKRALFCIRSMFTREIDIFNLGKYDIRRRAFLGTTRVYEFSSISTDVRIDPVQLTAFGFCRKPQNSLFRSGKAGGHA